MGNQRIEYFVLGWEMELQAYIELMQPGQKDNYNRIVLKLEFEMMI